jgi:uncharacterized protein (DUF2141 family)
MNPLDFISKKFIFSALAASLLFACARPGSPTGGPRDTEPPKVDTTASTRNFSTRFSERRIELVFDEWITLTDLSAQVVISPPLTNRPRPDISLKGKKVIVEFAKEDTLRSNTTYTINFGSAVKDLHEGNPAKDLRFVFSTGDFLDSLSVGGKVVDAFTNEPVENVSVMLYDNLSDSVLRKEKPYYFARTDKTGQYSIQNVRAGKFKVAAVEDVSGDLKWDGQSERIGFPDSLLLLNDSAKAILNLKMFKNQPPFRLLDAKTLRYGLVKLPFSASPDSVNLRTDAPSVRFLTEKVADTLLIWYDMAEPAAWQLFVGDDTVKVRDLPRADFFEKHKLSPADDVPAGGRGRSSTVTPPAGAPLPVKNVSQNPSKPAVLTFNAPVAATDTSKWLFVLDSARVADFSVKPDSAAPRNLKINLLWEPGKAYKLTLLPGAVTDFYGVANADTLQRVFNVFSEKQLGSLSLTLQNLTPGSGYVLQLLSGTALEEERIFVADAEEKKLTFSNLPAATYIARLVEDRNRNGRWDTGDYFAHRQPELIFSKKLEALRANWELEAVMRTEVEKEK